MRTGFALVPPTVKVIKEMAFYRCTQLMTVVLGKGLKEISEYAFEQCTLHHEIWNPPAIKAIMHYTSLGALG